MMLRLANEFKIRLGTLQHILEGYKVADEIAKAGAGGSAFADWWGYKFEAFDAIPDNAAMMHGRGVLTSINSDSDDLARRLNTEAAKSMKHGGVSPEDAIRFVTINAAKQLRIDGKIGSLEAGQGRGLCDLARPSALELRARRADVDRRPEVFRSRGGPRSAEGLRGAARSARAEGARRAREGIGKPKEGEGKDEKAGAKPTAQLYRDSQQHAFVHRPLMISRARRSVCCVAGSLAVSMSSGRASDQHPCSSAGEADRACKGATIHPVSGPEIANGMIVFDNGKITAVGADAPIPAGAEVIDASGKHVYPGLISANTRARPDGDRRRARDGRFRWSPARSTRTRSSVTSINPDSEFLPVTRSNGILTALAVPEGGLISGTSAVVRMDGWTPAEMTVRAPAAMHLRWPNLKINRDPARAEVDRGSAEGHRQGAEDDPRRVRASRAPIGTRAKPRHPTSSPTCAGKR